MYIQLRPGNMSSGQPSNGRISVEPDRRTGGEAGEHATAVGLFPQRADHGRRQLGDGGEGDLADGGQEAVEPSRR